MASANISQGTVTAIVAGTAVLLAACGTATSSDKPAAQPLPAPLGSSNQVNGNDDSWGTKDDSFEGTVTVGATPIVCAQLDGTRRLVFHVEVTASKGAVPTGYWQVQTENAIPIDNETLPTIDMVGPPLGSSVTGNAKGDIAFTVPPKTVPTSITLIGERKMFGATETGSIAQWNIGDLPPATTCPASG
ncbi:hypothetical protein H7J87_15295 [Mycolicibacterium wolinskyi]|uniref:DUF4352 domain-containing protein n=1 Tax=Mycolicibacterium wolinskyi TaxID=59750 RepID=A0A1X2F863_9MYCO|nr:MULTISPECIES: hypothetical protein [Mycolicibacterium]MCV7286692.1 hypothetical protein [Mycolicibacterium wolinskyi]MCV7293672.1 hypothetical protein [Mycolicibacterium goodii]ORX14607.1 hypothetical protein AWC31_25835 [Mycolicibacterium wolinskyi]